MVWFDVNKKLVVIAGGSKGLGRELALQLVSRGAHVTILARGQTDLDEACRQLESHAVSKEQRITGKSLDLLDVQMVTDYVAGLTQDDLPFALFCVAGGTEHELGFFADVTPETPRVCMEKNYLSSVYIAQALWKRWTTAPGSSVEHRHLIFTASTAALIALPGYDAYSPTKAAIRSLADILRQEALLYLPTVQINVHCAFPGTIYTDSFYKEQQNKPRLLKELEGSTEDGGGASAKEIARGILRGVDRREFFVTTDFNTRLLLNNMRGPSPRNSLFPVIDWTIGFVMSFIWPFIRISFDNTVRKEGKTRLA